MIHDLTAIGALALLTATSLTAQTPPELISLTAATPLIVRQGMADCRTRTCSPAFPPMSAPTGAAGGTAYSALRGDVWVSNGEELAAFDPETCRMTCRIHLPLAGERAFITGLAMHEARRTLVVSDSRHRIHKFSPTCPVTPRSVCTVRVPTGHEIGGLATDDLDDLVFFSTSDFGGSPDPRNLVWIAPWHTPCAPICSFPLRRCRLGPLGPIHGLAYDPCDEMLWATDGFTTVGLRVDVARCAVTETHCCRHGLAEPYIGLCIQPSQPTSSGRACVNGTCSGCPSIVHGKLGAPALGNPDYTLTLRAAPERATAFVLLSFGGPCRSPGLLLPPFCGRFLVSVSPLPPIALGPFSTGSTGACAGRADASVPIPLLRTLCGLHWCSQWAGFCGPTSSGTFVTNALSHAISGT